MKRFPINIVAQAAAAMVIVLASAAGVYAQPTAPAAGDAVRGKAAFLKFGCYECHGTVAQGNYMGIPHLAPHPIPQAALMSYIRKPSGQMPSYSVSILPDKDAADIWAYLNSIPAGKTPAEIPALSGVTTKPK